MKAQALAQSSTSKTQQPKESKAKKQAGLSQGQAKAEKDDLLHRIDRQLTRIKQSNKEKET